MDIAILICAILAVILLIVILLRGNKTDDTKYKELSDQLNSLRSESSVSQREQRQEINTNIQSSFGNFNT